jgi:hypothetical protein
VISTRSPDVLQSFEGLIPAQGNWVEQSWADSFINVYGYDAFNKIEGTWTVPPLPNQQSWLVDKQTLYYFISLETFKAGQGPGGIIQPVLQYGGPSCAGAGGGYWTIAAWYIDSRGNANFTTLAGTQPCQVCVNAGDAISGVAYHSLPKDNQWTVSVTDQTSGLSRTLTVAAPEYGFYSAQGRVLEAYGSGVRQSVTTCNDYPGIPGALYNWAIFNPRLWPKLSRSEPVGETMGGRGAFRCVRCCHFWTGIHAGTRIGVQWEHGRYGTAASPKPPGVCRARGSFRCRATR